MRAGKNMQEDKGNGMKRKRHPVVDFIDHASLESLITWMKIHHAMKPYWTTALTGVLASTVVTIVFDMLVPMQGNILGFVRALLAMITGGFYFMLGYSIAIYQSDSRRKHYDDNAPIDAVVAPYVEYRIRNSFRQRRRQSYPVLAAVLVLIISSAYSHMYTLSAGVALAIVFAVVVYVRPTESETVLLVNNKMDARDILDIADDIEYNETRKNRKRRAHGRKTHGLEDD